MCLKVTGKLKMTKLGKREGGTEKEKQREAEREKSWEWGELCARENNQALEERERKLKIYIEFYIYEETQNL